MEDTKFISTTSGSSLALSSVAAFIGLCCVGPIAVGLFGVTGAVFLARLEPARPYFLIMAALLVVFSGYIVYLKPIFDGIERTSTPSQHALFWVSLFLVLFAAFADKILGYVI
jgi:hypothetical protein